MVSLSLYEKIHKYRLRVKEFGEIKLKQTCMSADNLHCLFRRFKAFAIGHSMLLPLPFPMETRANSIHLRELLDATMKLILSIGLRRSERINFIEASK